MFIIILGEGTRITMEDDGQILANIRGWAIMNKLQEDVVNTEPTTSLSLLENSEARQNELEEEIRFLKKQNASMER